MLLCFGGYDLNLADVQNQLVMIAVSLQPYGRFTNMEANEVIVYTFVI